MFTFTKKADYALLALSHLHTEGKGRLVGPREIAARFDIPAELLAKIMQTLARHGLVASVAGPTGGYRLGREASAITIADVLEAVDGPFAITQCWDGGGTAASGATSGCAQAAHCTLREPLARIQDEMTRLLRTMTVDEISRPPKTPPGRPGPVGGYSLTMLDAGATAPVAIAASGPVVTQN
jgi:Rrf2 family protein